MAMTGLRETAESIFRHSLAECTVKRAFARSVAVSEGEEGRRLLIRGAAPIELGRVKHIRVVAAGKASATMLDALLSYLELRPHQDLKGILIGDERPADLPLGFEFFQGGHPLPNEASFAGARAVLEMLRGMREAKSVAAEMLCLFLISGGASAMMELPLDPAISLADMVSFHRELVHSGASIAEINCVRKHFSAVKGGRLGLAADGIENLSLFVSDVPAGHLDALASGPTIPDTSTVEQCRETLVRYDLLRRFPASVRRFFERADIPESPKPGEFVARAVTLLACDDLAEVARVRAEELGFHAVVDNSCDDWDYRAAAEYLVDRLRQLRAAHPRVCLISSGEVTVTLPAADNKGEPFCGTGGRNQHLSLYAATLLDPSDGSTVILSAGSDGVDGNSPAAGGVVDVQTLSSGEQMRAAAREALRDFDSHTFLKRRGGSIVTGATGNNLRDLRILLAEQH
ncbi:MAG TPA: DUF4147 domain-containing protein [Acidobacteriaceae bacterium]|nr:DUF4147 domain-containing protein [Acidobacteriaceae bacterium]